ncbi:MAG: ABC transporter substrate binding protein [Bacteroidota bacterium]
MELWIGAINLGILYAFMAIGTFITYKIYSFPDITIDGTFATGAAVASILIVDGWNPLLVLPVAFLVGSLAGFVTGFIHTRFKIEGLLAGILVMTGLYSVNLHIMGKSNIPLLTSKTFVSILSSVNPGLPPELWTCFFLVAVMLFFWILVSLFLKTDFGLTMRATGNNPVMVAAQGVSVNRIKIFGVAIANGFVGISGALIAQYQGFADIGMGIGSIIFSLAAVIIGEAILPNRSVFIQVLGVIIGSIIFRLAVAFSLHVGMNPNDLKLITAVFVLFTLIATGAVGKKSTGFMKKVYNWLRGKNRRIFLFLGITILIAGYIIGKQLIFSPEQNHMVKIGVVLANQSDILTKTRDGLYSELTRLGYVNGKNCTILEQNAEGDIPTNLTIIDHFIHQKVDIFIPISTASTQAALNKIKNRPIVFATVANPFMIGAGTSSVNHPPNITGVYGPSPIKELLAIFRQMYRGKVKIGVIYNPAYPNTVSNLKDMKTALQNDKDISLEEATVSNSNDVYQAALAIANRDVDAFVLINDLTVFNSFESVVRVSKNNEIPIFTCDAERLKDGALIVYGYEYFGSGMQAAHLVNRIIRGESPANIPFEKYKILTYGVNYDVARELSLSIPSAIRLTADSWVRDGIETRPPFTLPPDPELSREKKVALFQFSSSSLLDMTKQGFSQQINSLAADQSIKLKMEEYNAHGDFSTGQTIATAIVEKNYDYVVTFSTLALQIMASSNKKIPHVFCAVTDPIKAGVATTLSDHQPNLTGLATPQPVEATIKLMRQIFPSAKNVGMIWNTSEVNSEICTIKARAACKQYGFQLTERAITTLDDLDDARKSIISSGIDIFFISGDVMISQVIPQLAKPMTQKKIPFFSNTAEDVNSGTFISLGADYSQVGEKAASVFMGVLKGANPKDIPIELYVPYSLGINLNLAKEYGIAIPDTMISAAKIVIRQP